MAFRNKLDNRHLNALVNSGDDPAIHLYKFGELWSRNFGLDYVVY